ncbi:hypothetical protein [Hymenobacter baengnokdamensis]|uniref:hypothetical protein n=1 Tax=Hymenobacter baengnokdamensis TaxID=2615203 RepID=UPI0012462E93|nr:hypothetical protein [Hymenobacter baengnokdamensis]
MVKSAFITVGLLVSSRLSYAQSHPQLISDFRQTSAVIDSAFGHCSGDTGPGNCTTIALIKAALAEFGSINAVFTSFRRAADSTRCTFHDGTRVAVGAGELDTVRKMAGIRALKGQTSAFQQDALTMYTLICKRMWVLHKDFTDRNNAKSGCVKSFTNAVSLLDSGYPTRDAYRLLALQAVWITDYSRLATIPAAVIYSGPHAAFCTMGQQDRFGTTFSIHEVETMKAGKPVTHWMMGRAKKNGLIPESPIIGAYQLALPD